MFSLCQFTGGGGGYPSLWSIVHLGSRGTTGWHLGVPTPLATIGIPPLPPPTARNQDRYAACLLPTPRRTFFFYIYQITFETYTPVQLYKYFSLFIRCLQCDVLVLSTAYTSVSPADICLRITPLGGGT